MTLTDLSDNPPKIGKGPMAAGSHLPTRAGRWGVRQFTDGESSGGTVNCGWPTRAEAEAANPPIGKHTFEVYDRFREDHPA